SFRNLGPPDLYRVVKSNGKMCQRDLRSYHVSSVDASSFAYLAAYSKSLACAIGGSPIPPSGVPNGCYFAFSRFSRVDFRVDVKIPGGVSAYGAVLRGERCVA
ncbi:hypothetical protein B0H16DRAFT_1271394, partial [Mycena metata]